MKYVKRIKFLTMTIWLTKEAIEDAKWILAYIQLNGLASMPYSFREHYDPRMEICQGNIVSTAVRRLRAQLEERARKGRNG